MMGVCVVFLAGLAFQGVGLCWMLEDCDQLID